MLHNPRKFIRIHLHLVIIANLHVVAAELDERLQIPWNASPQKILQDSHRFSKILQDSPRFSREGKQTGIYIKCRSGVHRTLKRRVSSKIGKDSSSAFMTTVANSHFMVIRRRSQKQLQLRYGLENGKKNNCNIKVEDHN